MIIGKFMPPHRGHQLLVDFARHYAAEVTVLVCSIAREPIAGTLRYQWMREMFGNTQGVRVVHVDDELPQEPAEHPDFWRIWREVIRREARGDIDYVFASEAYGHRLAREVGASFVNVDQQRVLAPISGTQLRENPMKHWAMLPEVVRPYFAKRVCVFGPESSGKSTLVRELATHFQTVYAWEYARPLLDPKGGQCDYDDIARIARGQKAIEQAMARHANRVLFCDTNLLLTTIWSDVLFGCCPREVEVAAAKQQYDLTLLLGVDVPWVNDNQRYFPNQVDRESFFARCRERLDEQRRPYVVIEGDWDARFESAVAAVNQLLA